MADRATGETLPEGHPAQPPLGTFLLLEHTPVITVSNRPTAPGNLTASKDLLARHGVAVAPTDRGGDITYHGPGQLVIYPIVDLNRLGLRLHPYMRCMEEAVVQTCAHFGVLAGRDPSATGVWTGTADEPPALRRKLCAMGVRVSRWVTMHGLALNISPNMDHFGLIVPCGLTGRLVGSLGQELERQQRPTPSVEAVAARLAADLAEALLATDRPA